MKIVPNNQDLNDVFHNNPKYINNEYVIDAKVDENPLYLHPSIQ
jgi:hypothetical protein